MDKNRQMIAVTLHLCFAVRVNNNIRIRGMDGRGWGVGDGLPMVSRVSL